MGQSHDLVESLKSKLSISRRTFVKGTMALGAAAAVYGCSKNDGSDVIYGNIAGGGDSSGNGGEDLTPDLIRWGTSGHNCGGKCIIQAHVKNGKIVRFLTDDTLVDTKGNLIDQDNHNCTQSRACPKCRSYKFRLYHPGRLKYPLKQTKKRGDLSGFVRISWEEALNEISTKHKAITEKYGPEAFYLNYACGAYSSDWQGGGYTGLWSGAGTGSAAGNLLGGYTAYFSHYSFHQQSYFGNGFTGYGSTGVNNTANADSVAGVVKNVVLWGSNILTTVNPSAYPEIRSVEQMKERGGKLWFIGPEFVDTGVVLADTWVQMKPYTDAAVMLAMMYHLIDSTFDASGNVKAGALLDVDYLDSMVYGFFDSPEYWLKESDGTVALDQPADMTGYVKIEAVPAGRSLSAYIMGSDDRLTKARYDAGNNYLAQQFATKQDFRNGSVCSYPVAMGDNTKYLRKKDYLTPKTPEWAEAISGVPADTIRELAEIYAKPENHPVYSEWCGAMQKQAEGCTHFFILQSLLVVTKTWGQTADGYGRSFGASQSAANGALTVRINRPKVPSHPTTPIPSCTAWHNAIKFAFGDQLKAGGYTGKYIPDWNAQTGFTGEKGQVYHEDGGTKALLKWKRDSNGKVIEYTDSAGNIFYDYEKDTNGNPVYSGFRFILNPGGNILMNQHMNSNDSREMFEALPLATKDPKDPDTLCIVSFDNFLSPTPRWSDYVLPAATTWEQEDLIKINYGNQIYIPVVSNPPGQAKSMWNFTNEFLKAYEKVDPSKAGIATKFTGGIPNQQVEDLVKQAFATASVDATSPYYRKTWEEFLSKTYLPKTAGVNAVTAVIKTAQRRALDTYLALDDATRRTTPFIGKGTGQVAITSNTYASGGCGNQFAETASAPQPSRRFHVYSPILVWKYEHQFSKWHGYLPAGQRGQKNVDMEGDPVVYPIPMYFAYQDYFMEAYGGNLPADPICLTTTHDRYRAHSSQSENPYLRELTHRTKGGALYSGNDWNEYALIGEGNGDVFPRNNKAIQENKATASWSEIWINAEDAAERGIADGDLVLVQNAIGAVRCTARVTNRCVKGMAGLHQGCWYDPAEDGIDDGGNCNTLMASKPSRIDHGNGQQSAMVSITKC